MNFYREESQLKTTQIISQDDYLINEAASPDTILLLEQFIASVPVLFLGSFNDMETGKIPCSSGDLRKTQITTNNWLQLINSNTSPKTILLDEIAVASVPMVVFNSKNGVQEDHGTVVTPIMDMFSYI